MVSRLSTWSKRFGRSQSKSQHTEEVQLGCQQQKTEPQHGSCSINLQLMKPDLKNYLLKKEMVQLAQEMEWAFQSLFIMLTAEEVGHTKNPSGMRGTNQYSKISWLQTFNRMIQEGRLPTGNLITRMLTAKIIEQREVSGAMDVLRLIRLMCPAYSRAVYLRTQMLRDLVGKQHQHSK
ncbi:C protein [Langya virus]|uniref:C protein n=1 Tax=Langya virus TaxID=2971765 RepID=A0AAX3C936_9MONO|nr:C protein [Langya virus]UUV47210.1 C protein [Langya virus]UUV47217.1 C protein [Langya virus]UUV47224.1 C protein [Langya virus]UUV47231.1 C protein [Langya virus]